MTEFCHKYFIFIEPAVCFTAIAIILGNAYCHARKAEKAHRELDERLKSNKLVFDNSARQQAATLRERMQKYDTKTKN